MKKKIVIFDLDGTLLNTLQDLTDSTNFALAQFNYPQRTIDEIRRFVGNGVQKLIERATPDNVEYARCLEIFKQHYKNNMYNKTAPYSGIIEMLKKLKKSDMKIAVVSNKFDAAVKELCKKYFNNLVDIAAGENEAAGIRKKPAADMVIKILEQLDINNEEAVYVGDSEVDIETAKNAHLECISVLWGFKTKEFLLNHGAKTIISNPEELFNYILI